MSAAVFAQAAGNGNIEMLEWLREKGCPWNESVQGGS